MAAQLFGLLLGGFIWQLGTVKLDLGICLLNFSSIKNPLKFVIRNFFLHLDIISQLEIGKPEEKRKPEKRVNGIFWILLINLGIYLGDHVFKVPINILVLFLYPFIVIFVWHDIMPLVMISFVRRNILF